MKTMKRKVLILLILIVVVAPVLSGCATKDSYKYSQKNVKTVKVLKKKNDSSLIFSGNLEGRKETMIASKVSGQISAINVNIGDKVRRNDLLVTLSGEENYSERNTASNAYQNSLSGLSTTEYLMKQEIAKAEASLETTRQSLLAVQTTDTNEDTISSEQIKQAGLDLEKAKIAKESIDNIFEQKTSDILESINSSISQGLVLAKNALAYLYLINNENFSKSIDTFEVNDDFVSNFNERNQTAVLTKKAKTKYFETEESYTLMDKNNLLTNKLIVQSDATETMLKDLKSALRAMNTIILSAISHVDMTESQLSTYKTNLSNYILQIENMLLSQSAGVTVGLIGAKQSLENLNIEKESQIKQIDKDIQKAVKQLEIINANIGSLKDDLNSQTKIAEAQLKLAEGSLGSAKAQQDTQLQIAKSQVDLARGGLSLANVNVANTRLRAPYEGVVMERLVDEGSIVSAGTAILKVADVSSYKLIIFVPESKIRYIKVGQIATATTDSLLDESFVATVLRISPKSEESSRKVRVELEIENNEYLKIGMYMNLYIQLEEDKKNSDEILTITSEAIINEDDKNYVWTVVENKAYKKEIEIGKISNNDIEIVSGLTVGEEIIVKGFDSLIEGEEVVIKN
jgi:RND family efflux transporter MFP subunit